MGRNNEDFSSFNKTYQAWKDAANPADKRIRELQQRVRSQEDLIEDSFNQADQERGK